MKTLRQVYIELDTRISSLVNHGKEICEEYIPDTSSSFNSITCGKCGYSQEIHLIRDARDVMKNK